MQKQSKSSKDNIKKSKPHKYNAIKTKIDGITFDSKMEAQYYTEVVKPGLESGEIKKVDFHPKYVILPAFKTKWRSFNKVTYSADFLIEYASGETLLVDIKGALTKDFSLKFKFFCFLYDNIHLVLLKKKGKEWIEI